MKRKKTIFITKQYFCNFNDDI